jgi:hypothetical protein
MGALQATELGWRSSTGVSDFIPCVVSNNYSSVFSLALHRNVDSQGIVSWVDMGAAYDTIKTKFNIELSDFDDFLAFEGQLKNKEGAVNQSETETPVIRYGTGFYPLTPLYENCTKSGEEEDAGYYELALTRKPQPKQLNLNSDAVQYSLETVPNGLDLSLSPEIASCRKFDNWTLDGLGLPYPTQKVSPRLNSNSKSMQLNQVADNTSRYGRLYGETIKLTMNLDEERTRLFLAKMVVLRGEAFSVVTPLNFNFFAHLYPTNTSFQCILNKQDISLEFKGHKNINVSFSIQLVAVL